MLRSMTSVQRAITPLDAALSAIFVVLGVVYMIAVIADEGGSWAAVPLITLIPIALLWRRVAPLAALGGLVAAVGVHVALFGTVTRCGLFLPVDLLLVFAAAARLPMRMAVAALAAGLGAALLMLGFDASAPLDEAGVFVCLLVTGVWAAGAALAAVAHRSPSTTIAPATAGS